MATKSALVNVGLWSGVADAVADDRTFAAGSTLTLNRDVHSGGIILLNATAGSVVTLPAATGSGAEFTFIVSVLATSNSHKIQVANATDIMVGMIATIDTDTSDAVAWWATAATSDTITLNRSTTGSVRKGERIVVVDAAAGFWSVHGVVCVTGVPATMFSAAV